MARIDIRRKHDLPMKDARKAVDKLAKKIAQEFDVACSWDGNVLAFARSGVDGHIELSTHEVHVYADLGFLMGVLKPTIEREINRHLDEQIG